jgi:hypothetical protein
VREQIVERDDADQGAGGVDDRHAPHAPGGHQSHRLEACLTLLDAREPPGEEIVEPDVLRIHLGATTSTTMSRSVTIPTGLRAPPV